MANVWETNYYYHLPPAPPSTLVARRRPGTFSGIGAARADRFQLAQADELFNRGMDVADFQTGIAERVRYNHFNKLATQRFFLSELDMQAPNMSRVIGSDQYFAARARFREDVLGIPGNSPVSVVQEALAIRREEDRAAARRVLGRG